MKKKILIVDDEPVLLKILKRLLEQFQYEVITAESGHEAFQVIKLGEEQIGFVISDVRMSNGDGLELLSWIRGHGIQTPILLVSGFADISVAEVVKLGAVGIMSKPYDIEKICSVIESKK